jgi:hypothetical protein
MAKCEICTQEEATLAWQPFGPDENALEAFTLLGSHYRGFAVIKVCRLCCDDIQNDGHPEFVYADTGVIVGYDGVPVEVPAYVDDALLWLDSAAEAGDEE